MCAYYDYYIETDKSQRVGVEEKFIKFKSSPNFKNMKKFLKSKIDYTELPVYSSPESGSTASSPSACTPSGQSVQPPLPLDPPPPDSPSADASSEMDVKDASLRVEIVSKVEKPDEPEEYEQLEEVPQIKTEPQKPEPCRDFIRGTCTRPGCRFLHEYNLTHLNRVYTFCRNYQNSVCTLPNCRYVHASVFEEQAFYRTGILPPHALAPHKSSNGNINNSNVNNNNVVPNSIEKSFILQPPPPPPPPVADLEELPQHLNINLNPANLYMSDEVKTIPMVNCLPASANVVSTHKDPMVEHTSPNLKRSWSEREDFIAAPCGQEANAKRANKCDKCVLLENRLQYTKDKVETMTKSTDSFAERINELEQKNHRVLACLLSIVKPMAQINYGQNSVGAFYSNVNLHDSFPMFQEQDKVSLVADQIKQLLQSKMTKFNAEDKTLKVFQMSTGNNVQPNPSSVNLANLSSTRQLTNLFNGWGSHP